MQHGKVPGIKGAVFSGTSALKAVLTEGDSVSDAVTDIVSLVHIHRQNDMTLTVPGRSMCEHAEPRKSANKEETEVKRPTPLSLDWVVRQVVTEAQDGKVKVHLRQWMNYEHCQEIDDELVNHLPTLNEGQLKEAIKELGGQKRDIRGSKGNQLATPVAPQTEDMVKQFTTTGLIDSGCTGSRIDVELVKRYNIPTKKLGVPLLVYNADESLNSMGKQPTTLI